MHHLGNFYTEVLRRELYEMKEPEEIYYHVDFHDETKIEVNLFKLRKLFSSKCN